MNSAATKSPRKSQLAMIHIAASQLGMDDSTYRDMLWSVARVRSAKDLDTQGRTAVLRHLQMCGWKPPRRGGTPRYRKGSQAALIRHLWTCLERAGQVQDGSERALRSYVRTQSASHDPAGHGWDHPTLLPRTVASAVIEHLKQWCQRAKVDH